jgi:hypothetical protein
VPAQPEQYNTVLYTLNNAVPVLINIIEVLYMQIGRRGKREMQLQREWWRGFVTRWQQKDTENAVGSCNSPDFRQESGGKTDGTSLFHPVDGICPWEVSQKAKLQENRGFLCMMVVLFLTR